MKATSSFRANKLSRPVKISFYVIGAFVLLTIVALVGGRYLQGELPEKLKSFVHKKTHGEYTLRFDRMSVNLITGNLKLKNLSLIPDTNGNTQRTDSTAALYVLSATELKLTGLEVINYLLHKKLLIHGIKIENPEITVIKARLVADKDAVGKTLYEQLPQGLRGTQLSFIEVQNLSFSKRTIGHMHEKVNRVEGLSFRLNAVRLDSAASMDSTRNWFCRDIVLDSKDVTYSLGNGMYVFLWDKIMASSQKGILKIQNFRMIPQYGELEFSKRLGTEGDRYDIEVPSIALDEINFKALETDGKLSVRTLILSDGKVHIFNNKTLPETGKNKIQNAPHLALQRVGIPINIDTVQLKSFEVHYREKSPVSNTTGDIFFTNLNGTLTHVSNDSIALADNAWCRSHFEMNFLGKSKIEVNLNLNLRSESGEFNYEGFMSPSSVTQFNSVLQPMAMAKATDGRIRKLTFDVKANKDGSTGTVQFLYKNLEVDLLIRDNSGKIGRRGLVSFLANEVVISPNNPDEGQPARIGRFSYRHPSTRSFFNLMWKSILSGLKEIIIVDKEAIKEQKKLNKEKRQEERREKRRERRLEKSKF